MTNLRRWLLLFTSLLLLPIYIQTSAQTRATAQGSIAAVGEAGGVVLPATELARVVPPGFYYEGQSALTQMRNSAAARFGKKHLVIAGLVDTSGYSADVQAKYQGFFITDAPISFGDGSVLHTGAYGFGFVGDKFNVYDVAGNQLLAVASTSEKTLPRPRPLSMSNGKSGVRLYSGRNYVEFSPRVETEL